MWRNPRYAAEAPRPQPAPPAEQGRRLAALTRTARDQPDCELRVALDEYQGHPYISIRLWQFAPRSGGWPIKGRGVSARTREAGGVAAALLEAARRAGGPEARPADRPDTPAARAPRA